MTVGSWIKPIFRSVGLDLQKHDVAHSFDLRLAHLLQIRKVDVVFDVGANTGQYARLLRSSGYPGRIISFEPLTTAHAELLKSSQSDPRWEVAPRAAIGEAEGEVEIHVAGNSASSSLLDMLEEHRAAAPHSAYVGVEKTPLHRLDNLAPKFLAPEDKWFLKIDTQGYEAPVLRGTSGLSNPPAGIQLELSLRPLYDGQLLYREMIQLVVEMGYELWDIVPGFRDQQQRLLQLDAVFFRSAL